MDKMPLQKRKLAIVATIPQVVRYFLVNHVIYFSKLYDVTVVSNFSGEDSITDILSEEVRVRDIPIRRPISLLMDIITLVKLIRYLHKEKTYIVYSVTPKGGLLGMLAAWFTGVPIRIHTYTGQVWATKKGLSRLILMFMDRIVALLATQVIVDSYSQRSFLIEHKIVSKTKSLVLCDGSISGVDTERFQPNHSIRQEVRNGMGVGNSTIVFLFIGRIKSDKGVFDLAEAFSNICNEKNNIALWFVGPDEDRIINDLKLITKPLNCSVSYIPHTKTPEKYMVSADIFCLPSYREGFGTSIIEAAACGIPSIGSKIYGIMDAIRDRETGILVERGNVDALASAMLELTNNEYLRNYMGKSAQINAVKRFDKDRISRALLNVIKTTKNC